MTVATSACVDCGTPIIGDRLRCPACHEHHANDVVAAADDVEATVPRPRMESVGLLPSFIVAWIVIAELIAIVALLSVFVLKGCL